MKKLSKIWILFVGIALVFLSYILDMQAENFFKTLRTPLLDATLGIITNFGVVVLFMVIVPTIILYKKNKKIISLLWINFFISLAATFILKLVIARQRPVEAFTYPFSTIINYSFPSMHAVVAFSLMAMLNENMPKQKNFWNAFACLVALSRLYFGVHYLSDVVSGALIGYFIGHYLSFLYKKYGKNK